MSQWQNLNEQIVACQRCPRLIKHCQKVAIEKRRAFIDHEYWGRPVPNLGSSRAEVLIVGLAPAAHGANRTGRMFTGDRSGDWLFAAMNRAGFCNQGDSTEIGDGLKLKSAAITAVCHCAPPDNKPATDEITNCRPFLEQSIELCRPKVLLALGGLAWRQTVKLAKQLDWYEGKTPKFSHGQTVLLAGSKRKTRWLVGSYHPSQQNTFTGRLTREMFDEVFEAVRAILDS